MVRSLLQQDRAEEAARTLVVLPAAEAALVTGRFDPPQAARLLQHLPPEFAARMLERLRRRDAIVVAGLLSADARGAILERVNPDLAGDLLRGFAADGAAQSSCAKAKALEAAPRVRSAAGTATSLMVPDVVTLREWMTAEEAILSLRGSKPPPGASNHLLVLDRRNGLTGMVSLRDLVMARAESQVRDLMDRNVVTVTAATDQEKCARLMARYNLAQLAVVNERKQVLGVILAEDIIDVVESEAEEDMLRLAGIAQPEHALGPVRRAFKARFVWLTINLATVVVVAGVVDIFESTIAKAAFLVMFLPLVENQGSTAGTQTLTLVTRGLALGELSWMNACRALRREVALGMANGLAFGAMAGAIAWAWKGNATLGLIVFLAMLVNLVAAGLFGAVIPLGLKALRQDPALGSAVILTTITDVAAVLAVLGLAAWWLA